MKRTIIGLFVGLFAFLLGVGVSLAWDFPPSQEVSVGTVVDNLNSVPIQTSVCEMLNGGWSFDEKVVEFEAVAYMNPDGTIDLYPKDCLHDGPNFLYPMLDINSNNLVDRELRSLVKGLKRTSPGEHNEVEVRIVGTSRIVAKYVREMYFVDPIEIEFISPFRPPSLKDGGG